MAGVVIGMALLYILGAALLGLGWLQSDAFNRLESSEAVHVVAHVGLYASLTIASHRLFRRKVHDRVRWTAATALGVGILQESAQLVVFGRWPGSPELFDLFVDAAAIGVTIVLLERRSRQHRRMRTERGWAPR
jgi:VanZ family protein